MQAPPLVRVGASRPGLREAGQLAGGRPPLIGAAAGSHATARSSATRPGRCDPAGPYLRLALAVERIELVEEPRRLLVLAGYRGHHEPGLRPRDRDVEQPPFLGQLRSGRGRGRRIVAPGERRRPAAPSRAASRGGAGRASCPPARQRRRRDPTPGPCWRARSGSQTVVRRAAAPRWRVAGDLLGAHVGRRTLRGPAPGSRSMKRAAASNSATTASRSRSAAAPDGPPAALADSQRPGQPGGRPSTAQSTSSALAPGIAGASRPAASTRATRTTGQRRARAAPLRRAASVHDRPQPARPRRRTCPGAAPGAAAAGRRVRPRRPARAAARSAASSVSASGAQATAARRAASPTAGCSASGRSVAAHRTGTPAVISARRSGPSRRGRADEHRHPRPGQPVEVGAAQHAGQVRRLPRWRCGTPRPSTPPGGGRGSGDQSRCSATAGQPCGDPARTPRAAPAPHRRAVLSAIVGTGAPRAEPLRRRRGSPTGRRRGRRRSTGPDRRPGPARRRRRASSASSSACAGSVSWYSSTKMCRRRARSSASSCGSGLQLVQRGADQLGRVVRRRVAPATVTSWYSRRNAAGGDPVGPAASARRARQLPGVQAALDRAHQQVAQLARRTPGSAAPGAARPAIRCRSAASSSRMITSCSAPDEQPRCRVAVARGGHAAARRTRRSARCARSARARSC